MANHPYAEPEQPWQEPGAPAPKSQPFQFPVWAIIVGFITWWPLGLIFLGLNWFIKEGNLDLSAAKRAGQTAAPSRSAGTPIYAQPAPSGTSAAPKPARAAKTKPAKPARKKSENSTEVALFIAGLCLLFTGAVALPEGLYWLTDALQSGGTYWLWLAEELIPAIGMLAGGVGCLFGAGRIKDSRRMRKKLKNIVGDAKYRYIEDIAAAVPCDAAKCCKLLEDAIDKGDFGPGAYLDMNSRCLVVQGQAPAAAPKPEPAPQEPAPADPYQPLLDELRRINDDIDDKVMSEKISRLEVVSARIFDQARDNPDKLPQMRKFMDYYLPTAKKLLKTYAELEEQGIEGDNITESKNRIANAMDTLVTAFEHQLDQLFQADALDVSTDIDVMEHMLQADGLAGNPFGKETN